MNRIFFRIFASAFLLSACAPEVFASTNGTANAVSGKQKFGRIKDETYIVTNGYTRAEIDSKIPQVVEGSLSPYGTNAVKTALGSYVTKSVTNEVAGQVRSLETSKQDALPYPTNAIPPSAISNPPWQTKMTDYTTTNAVRDIVEDYGYATPGVAGAIATNVVGEKVAPWAMAGKERLPDNVLTLTNNAVKTVGGTSALPKQIDAVSASEFAKPWRKWGGYQALQTVSYGGKLWVCALNHSGEEVFNEQGHWIDLVSRIDTDRSWLHWRDMWIDNNYAPRNGDVNFGTVTASSVNGNLNGSVTVGSGKTLAVQNGATFTIGGSNFNTVVDRAIDAKVTSATNAVAGKIHRITATNGVSAIDGDLSIFDKKGCDYTAQNSSFYYSIHWDEGGNPYWTANYSGASWNYNFRIWHVSGTTWHVVCPELSIDENRYNVGALWDNTLYFGPVYGGVLTKCAVRTPTQHGSVVSSALKINGIPLTNDITIAGTNAKDVNDLIANYVKTNSATTNLTGRLSSKRDVNNFAIYGADWDFSAFEAINPNYEYHIVTNTDNSTATVYAGNMSVAEVLKTNVAPSVGGTGNAPTEDYFWTVTETPGGSWGTVEGAEIHKTRIAAVDMLAKKSEANVASVNGATGAVVLDAYDIPGIKSDPSNGTVGEAFEMLGTMVQEKADASTVYTRTVSDSRYVPNTLKVNGQPLTSDITIEGMTDNALVLTNNAVKTKSGTAVTASQVGAADSATVSQMGQSLTAVAGHLNAEDARFVSTNYDSVVRMPEAYVEIKINNNWQTIWKEMTRWTKFVGNAFNWNTWQGFYAWSTNVTAQLATKAERCWGIYDSETGELSPDGYTQISSSNILIAANMSYKRVVDTANAIWVLESNSGLATLGGTNGYFRVKDGDGNTQFEIIKGNLRELGCDAGGITVDNSGATPVLTIPYSVNANSHPTLKICTNLTTADWKAESDATCAATVAWSGSSGAYVATVTAKSASTAMFIKATYMGGSETIINNIAPTKLQYIYIGNTKYAVGYATINGTGVMTLTPQ